MLPLNVTVAMIVKARRAGSVIRMASVDKELHSAGTPVDRIQTCAAVWTEYV